MKIVLLIYFFAGFFAAVRFKGNKYFYYILALAAAEPILFIAGRIIKIDYTLYSTIVMFLIVSALPTLDYKKKIIAIIVTLLTILHYEFVPLVFLIINETILGLILITFLDDFYSEHRDYGKGSIFLILLSLDTILTASVVFLVTENMAFLVSIRFIPVILNTIIYILMLLLGPNVKIEVGILKYFTGRINNFSKKVITDVNGNILLNGSETTPAILEPLEKHERKFNNDLTRTEMKILDYLSMDLTNSEIADKCNVSKKTIENHLQHIREKLEMSSMFDVRKFAHKPVPEDSNS